MSLSSGFSGIELDDLGDGVELLELFFDFLDAVVVVEVFLLEECFEELASCDRFVLTSVDCPEVLLVPGVFVELASDFLIDALVFVPCEDVLEVPGLVLLSLDVLFASVSDDLTEEVELIEVFLVPEDFVESILPDGAEPAEVPLVVEILLSLLTLGFSLAFASVDDDEDDVEFEEVFFTAEGLFFVRLVLSSLLVSVSLDLDDVEELVLEVFLVDGSFVLVPLVTLPASEDALLADDFSVVAFVVGLLVSLVFVEILLALVVAVRETV